MKLTGFATIIGNTKPNLVDTTSATTLYEGYQSGSSFIICKIDLSTPVISRTWATGNWTDRLTLTYQ